MRSTALTGGSASPKTLRVSSRLLGETTSPWWLIWRRRSASCRADLGSAQSMRRSFNVGIRVSPTGRALRARGAAGVSDVRVAARPARVATPTRLVAVLVVMVELYGCRGAIASRWTYGANHEEMNKVRHEN